MSASLALRNAADLLDGPGKWTRGTFARAECGTPVGSSDPRAVCWCAYGAVIRVSGGSFCSAQARRPIFYLQQTIGGMVGDFNDKYGRTQEQVVAALREAAEFAESEGQ